MTSPLSFLRSTPRDSLTPPRTPAVPDETADATGSNAPTAHMDGSQFIYPEFLGRIMRGEIPLFTDDRDTPPSIHPHGNLLNDQNLQHTVDRFTVGHILVRNPHWLDALSRLPPREPPLHPTGRDLAHLAFTGMGCSALAFMALLSKAPQYCDEYSYPPYLHDTYILEAATAAYLFYFMHLGYAFGTKLYQSLKPDPNPYQIIP